MSPSELKARVTETGSLFFTRDNMAFSGDTLSNYGVRRAVVKTPSGPTDVWELYRRRPVKSGLQGSAYFDPTTFKRVFP